MLSGCSMISLFTQVFFLKYRLSWPFTQILWWLTVTGLNKKFWREGTCRSEDLSMCSQPEALGWILSEELQLLHCVGRLAFLVVTLTKYLDHIRKYQSFFVQRKLWLNKICWVWRTQKPLWRFEVLSIIKTWARTSVGSDADLSILRSKFSIYWAQNHLNGSTSDRPDLFSSLRSHPMESWIWDWWRLPTPELILAGPATQLIPPVNPSLCKFKVRFWNYKSLHSYQYVLNQCEWFACYKYIIVTVCFL